MRKIFILFFLIVSLSIIPEENDLIAILNINSKIINKKSLEIISSTIYQGLKDTKKYNILDNNELKIKLSSTNIKITECKNNDCYKMINNILNARIIISGKIIKFNNLYKLNVDCYNTQIDKIIFSFYEEGKTINDIYKKATNITKKLEDNLTPKLSVLKQYSLYHTMQDQSFDNNFDDSFYKIDFKNNNYCNVKLNEDLFEMMKIYKDYVFHKSDTYYRMKNGVICLVNKSDKVYYIKFFNKKMHTVEGFYIGDTVIKMKELYGEPDEIHLIDNGIFGLYHYNMDFYTIRFCFNIMHGEKSNIINCIEVVMN